MIWLLQLRLFAEFVVGDKCDFLGATLHRPDVMRLLDNDPRCLDASGTVCSGLLLLGVAAITIHLGAYFVIRRAREAVQHDHAAGVTTAYALHSPRARSTADDDADADTFVDKDAVRMADKLGLLN